MAYKIIKRERMTDGYTEANVMEIMIEGAEDVASLPEECEPGSIAYTADMSYIVQLNMDGEWVEIGEDNGVNGGSSGDSSSSGVGLPEGAMPYQQLVTDGEGNVVWEDRTHYTKYDEISGEATLAAADGEVRVSVIGGIGYTNDNRRSFLHDNSYFVVDLNGTEYKKSGLTGTGAFPLGSYNGIEVSLEVRTDRVNTPFSGGVVFASAPSEDVNVKMSYCYPGEKEKLLEDYIPSSVPVIQSAEVGQTVVVKAVDADGKPTEWEAVDMGGGSGGGYDMVIVASNEITSSTNDKSILSVESGTCADVLAAIKAGRMPKVLLKQTIDFIDYIDYICSEAVFAWATDTSASGEIGIKYIFALREMDKIASLQVEVYDGYIWNNDIKDVVYDGGGAWS